MDSVTLLMFLIAVNVLVLILSSSLDLIVARIRRSGTKCVYIFDASTTAPCVSSVFARNLGMYYLGSTNYPRK